MSTNLNEQVSTVLSRLNPSVGDDDDVFVFYYVGRIYVISNRFCHLRDEGAMQPTPQAEA